MRILAPLIKKGWRHWVVVVLLGVLGIYLGRWLGHEDIWIEARYRIYYALQSLVPHEPRPKATAVVLIGDDEYWKGELARRSPIKRDYLAKLVRALASANAAVIALDFDMRSPTPDGSLVNNADYERETRILVEAIKAASQRARIVLPAPLGRDPSTGLYVLESDVFAGVSFDPARVRKGYINLPHDLRQIPYLPVKERAVESFSLAVARSFDEQALKYLPESESLPYGTYIKRAQFPVIYAGQVLAGAADLKQFGHKIVLIGGAWSRFAHGRGAEVDSYFTPIGWVPGVFIHANYVEAVLDSRTFPALGEGVQLALEILAVLLIAVVFALDLRARTKLKWVAGLLGGLLLLSYFFWQNLGVFFDFFIPIILLSGHFAIEQIQQWRDKAGELDVVLAGQAGKGD
jgi:CHASE2 domain-containing sensor protein